MSKMLILLRGVSGAGKSKLANILAEALSGRAYAADDFLMNGDKYEWSADKLGEAHMACVSSVESELSSGSGIVIVHNTMTSEKDVVPYKEIADRNGAMLISLVVENRHGGKNTHGVPQASIDRQARKLLNSIKLI
jgi:energy-coupling factor transporter ATP-binding protein EcfA2